MTPIFKYLQKIIDIKKQNLSLDEQYLANG
jgi:hypothetical protein